MLTSDFKFLLGNYSAFSCITLFGKKIMICDFFREVHYIEKDNFVLFVQKPNLWKPISIMFKVKFTSYLVITRKDLEIVRKLSCNYEKNILLLREKYLVITRKLCRSEGCPIPSYVP